MPEGGGLSYGGAGEYPEYSWEIVCGEGHTYIRSGDRVALSAIGEKCDVWSRLACVWLTWDVLCADVWRACVAFVVT